MGKVIAFNRNPRYDEVYNIIYKFLREYNFPKKEIKKI